MNIIPRDQWLNMENFFDDIFTHRHLTEAEGAFKPRVDIIEKDNNYVFVAELPGVEKKDINVNIQDGVLTIEAKMNEETTSETDQMIRKERRSGFFSRNFNVEKSINVDEIKAEFMNGLLKLTIPKPTEAAKEAHKIDIH